MRYMVTFQGRSTPGLITFTGNSVFLRGDKLVSAQSSGSPTLNGVDVTNLHYFQPFIVNDGSFTQSSNADLSTTSFYVLMERAEFAPIGNM